MAATFDRERWIALGTRTGCERVILDRPRLLRPGSLEDQDYVDTVAEVVPALLGQKSYGGRVVELSNLTELETFVGLKQWLAENDPMLYQELYGTEAAASAAEGEDDRTGPAAAPAAAPLVARPPEPAVPTGRRSAFLVHGRDLQARNALADLLRAFDLKVIDWDEASRLTGVTTPYTGDVITAGMNASDAVVVLLTADDLAKVRPEYLYASDGEAERFPTGQPRMNVLFEAGMAMARDRERVVLVQVGVLRPMSDIAGLNVVQLADDVESRRQLGRRLHQAGLSVEMDHDRWRHAGTFPVTPLGAEMDTSPS